MDHKVYWILFVALGFAEAASDHCPGPESLLPCQCQTIEDGYHLYCHDEDMTLEDLKKILTAFDEEDPLYLQLYFVNLGTVPTDFFQGFNIIKIIFAHCKFEQIPDEEGRVLVGLEDSLEELTVIATIERQNSPVVLDLSHLKKLTTLHLSGNTIPELSDEWFKKGPTSLTHLYIRENGIEKIGSNAFASLPNLTDLYLDGNRFGEMKRSMLPNPAIRLEDLQLNDNNLETFPEDFFAERPSLTRLVLENNKFKVLPEATFKHIWAQLDYLDLGGNPLNCEDSVLDWMVKSSHTPIINGVCAKPPEREGNDISDVIEGKQAAREHLHW